MNPHLYAALIGAFVCVALLALILWEVRQHKLANDEVGKPCRHGKPRAHCPICRHKLGLFSLFWRSSGTDDDRPADDQDDE